MPYREMMALAILMVLVEAQPQVRQLAQSPDAGNDDHADAGLGNRPCRKARRR